MGPKCKSHPDFTIDILSKITQHLDDILGFSKETHHFHPFPILTSMILYVFEFRSQGEKMRETLTIFHHLPSSSIIFHHLPSSSIPKKIHQEIPIHQLLGSSCRLAGIDARGDERGDSLPRSLAGPAGPAGPARPRLAAPSSVSVMRTPGRTPGTTAEQRRQLPENYGKLWKKMGKDGKR